MTYYAAFNSYGIRSDYTVAGFATIAARDAWVDMHQHMVAHAISRDEARKLACGLQRHHYKHGGNLAEVVFLTDDNKTFVRAY